MRNHLHAAWWIGWYAFLDSWRNRLVLGVFLLLIPILIGAGLLQAHNIELQSLVVRDIGLLVLWGFGLLVLSVLIFDQVFPDLERGSAFFTLSRISSRSTYLGGRFIGLFLTLAAVHLFLGGGLFLALRLMFGTWFSEFPAGVFLILLAQSMFAAPLLFLATTSSRLLTLSFGTLIFIGGHFTDPLRTWATRSGNAAFMGFADALGLLLPNFSLFASRMTAVFGAPITPGDLAVLTIYAAAISLFYLALAGFFLARRDL